MSSVDDTINNFISVAERFHGVREGTPQHSIILALYNSSKPAGEYEMGPNDPWCAAFVGAVSGGCGLERIVPVSAHCGRLETALIASGATKEMTPSRGDIALFDWNGDGRYDDHTGIVTKVEDRMVTTIEGNRNDMVAYRQFSPGTTPVIFYRPNWEGKSVQSTNPIQWEKYREYYSELTWDEKNEIKTFPMLQVASHGIYVKILQDLLGLQQDGNFGTETRDQLLLYQKEKQLEPDGICGRQTWSSFFA
jgi:peptidoglycan hydrolase-like protein with peptidoglycan-binding domain